VCGENEFLVLITSKQSHWNSLHLISVVGSSGQDIAQGSAGREGARRGLSLS
jgi:hypothetical protein